MSIDLFKLSDPSYPYVIAEIGNNHQGSIDKAFKMIDQASWAGADAVKFQKRCNKELFTPEFYNSPYINANSFGDTYGEHRDFLELSIEDMGKLNEYCKKKDIVFFATPFDFKSLEELEHLNLPFYKVASADVSNTPFLEKIAKTKKNVILSTGHSNYSDIERAISCFNQSNSLAVLHCTAAYPSPEDAMNLSCIPELIEKFSNCKIGLSDHQNGIDAASIAYVLGARVFEKHFTLNHSDKGTDNAFSLEPEGLKKLIRNLHRIPKLMGNKEKKPLDVEQKPIYKMSKSIVYKENYEIGTNINEDCFEYRCPGDGLPPHRYSDFLGKVLVKSVKKFDYVKHDHFN
tara:strand:- start:2355 stop:3389 length:1035 start_codon:yes stop_codon:yes gene_type:complete